jgi:hypothetical protein
MPLTALDLALAMRTPGRAGMERDSTTSGAPRARLDARMTAWLIEQRARARQMELDKARLEGELAASERIERAAQRYADKLEERLAEGRRREAALARALGYAEAQRDLLQARLGPATSRAPELAEHELVPEPPPVVRSATRPRGVPGAR